MPLKGSIRLRTGVFAVSTTVWTVIILIAMHLGLGDFFEHRVVRSLEFSTREALGAATPVHPKLKVYALDDSTAGMLGSVRLTTEDWLTLLPAIAAEKPRAILIDGMFSTRQSEVPGQEDAVRALASLPARIAVGATISPRTIKFRDVLPPARFAAGWAAFTPAAPIFGDGPAFAYGPTALFQEGFRDIGHIVQAWPARFAPAMRLEGGTAAAHLALFAARERRVTADGVVVDGQLVPTDGAGLAPIDFESAGDLATHVLSLKGPLTRAKAGQPIGLSEDDVVLIINNFSTGNTDFFDTPLGRIPGGYIIMSLVNSVMSGRWLAEPIPDAPMVALFAVLGTLIGAFSTSAFFWLNLSTLAAVHVGVSLLAFSYGQTIVPWLFPVFATTGAGISAYAWQRYHESKRRLHLEMEVATASALQQTFFPPPLCNDPRFALAAYYHPAEAVGGDWYTYSVYGGRWLHVHLGDVTGHGTSAALLASFAKGATDMIYEAGRRAGRAELPLEDLHISLNNVLGIGDASKSMMTMASLAIDLETGLCHYLNSGHRPVVIVRPDATAETLATRDVSTILGYQELPETMKPKALRLSGDETILIKSDGLIDVPGSRGVRVNERSLKRLMAKQVGRTPEEIRTAVAAQLKLTDDGPAFIDDVTFIVIRLTLSAKDAKQVA